MIIATKALILLIAIEHIGFLVLEMFLWTKPVGLKVFGQSLEVAQQSATLAANQGLYNGFLAAGLIWSAFDTSDASHSLKVFFLSCVLIAGLYGWQTVSSKILVVQAIPAAVTLALVLFVTR